MCVAAPGSSGFGSSQPFASPASSSVFGGAPSFGSSSSFGGAPLFGASPQGGLSTAQSTGYVLHCRFHTLGSFVRRSQRF